MPVVLLTLASALAGYGDATDGYPSRAEREAHLWTNAVRLAPLDFEADYGCRVEDWRAGEREGKPALAMDLRLVQAARNHSEDMASRNYFAHDTPEGDGPDARVAAEGYRWSLVGENIALGAPTPLDAILGWMCSSGHRSNIMEAGFRELGVGQAAGGRGQLWTQNFGDRSGASRRVLPMGVHSGRGASPTFRVNVDASAAPSRVVVVVAGEGVDLSVESGTEAAGTWSGTAPLPEGCAPYWFEATVNGEVARFPEEGAYVLGDCDLDDPAAGWLSADTTRDLLGGTTQAELSGGGGAGGDCPPTAFACFAGGGGSADDRDDDAPERGCHSAGGAAGGLLALLAWGAMPRRRRRG